MALKVVGSNPINHPLQKIIFFRKNKIKKRQFKKKTFLIKKVQLYNIKQKLLQKNLLGYTKYNLIKRNKLIKSTNTNPLIITLSQKIFNPKNTIFFKKNLNTFSVGSIIKYFKINQAKYIRRSIKGVKIILNFLKNIIQKIYSKKNTKYTILNVVGVDYNLLNLSKLIKTLVKPNNFWLILLLNIKISFTKKKEKKVKAIKKRLKKKIISNFRKKITI